MSLSSSISVVQGATGATLTGGSAVSFVNDGQGTSGKKVLVDSSNGNINTRKRIITGVVVGYPGTAAKPQPKLHRASVDMHQPFIDSNSVKSNLPANFSVAYHPQMTQAERVAHFWNVIAVLVDGELLNLLTNIVND